MGILLNGEVYQMRLFWTRQEQTAIVVRHYQVQDVDGIATDSDLALSLATELGTELKAILSVSASFRGVGIQRILPLPRTIEVFNTSTQGLGTVLGNGLPKQVAFVVNLRTIFAGRRFRGRSYLPFPGGDDNDGDTTPTAAAITRLINVANDLIESKQVPSGIGPTLAVPVVFSRVAGTVQGIVASTARDKWGTQRRRGDFGSSNSSPI